MTYTELKELSETRIKEAEVLLNEGYYDGANYLMGYVIELALKARICKLLNIETYPESKDYQSFKVHKLDILLTLAGLRKEFEAEKLNENFFDICWSEITEWSEVYRYKPIGTFNHADCGFKYDCIKFIFNWIKTKW